MEKQLATRDPIGALETISELEDRFAIAVRQRELLEQYIKERLTPGKHFYQISGSKNSLTKEGAELICLPHGYKPMYFHVAGPDQPVQDSGGQPLPYQITMRCRLMKGDSFAGEGIGSSSSYQTTRTGEYKPRQKDPGLCHNATLKMAQKSAYIAATLNATAASEFFAQDMEDESDAPKPKVAAGNPDDGLYCGEHQTAWFKKGAMRNYAHPIKDARGEVTGWCNMPKAAETTTPAPSSGDALLTEAEVQDSPGGESPTNAEKMAYINGVLDRKGWTTASNRDLVEWFAKHLPGMLVTKGDVTAVSARSTWETNQVTALYVKLKAEERDATTPG